MKLSELSKLYEFNLEDVESLVFEQEGHVGRILLMPYPSDPLHYQPDQEFNEDKYPYVTVELKDKEILDCKIGKYCWITSCPKATGCGVPS